MMRKSIIRDLVILIVIFGMIWGIVSVFPIFPEKIELVSVDREEELGELYLEIIQKDPTFSLIENQELDSIVEIIGTRLIDGLGKTRYEYKFFLAETEMINAFTLPGANIVITTGLINFCESAEELAAVIAHEMGHAENRDVISRLVKELGLQILTSSDPFVMGEVTRVLSSTGFDRKQEKEADLFACELLENSDIEPRTLASFFRKLKEDLDNDLLEKFEIVSTHPNFTSRIRETLEYVPSEDFEEIEIEIEWQDVLKMIEKQ